MSKTSRRRSKSALFYEAVPGCSFMTRDGQGYLVRTNGQIERIRLPAAVPIATRDNPDVTVYEEKEENTWATTPLTT